MPRIGRIVNAGFPHHVIQRGNNRQPVFFDHQDRLRYLYFLSRYAVRWDTSVLAYCLMTNHVHLLVRPNHDNSLYKMMQGVTLCYTQHINRTYSRTGRLWESRFHSCPVDQEIYLWAVMRYIEQNPIRAGLVDKAEDYPYSSAKAHVLGCRDDALSEDIVTDAQREDYIQLLRSGLSAEEVDIIGHAAMSGRPLVAKSNNKINKTIKWDVSLEGEEMAFERFTDVKRRISEPKITIRLSGAMTLSSGAVKKFSADQYKHAVLYFDRDERKIGIRLTNEPEEGAVRLIVKKSFVQLSIGAFIKHYDIVPREKSESFSPEWDEGNKMIVLALGRK